VLNKLKQGVKSIVTYPRDKARSKQDKTAVFVVSSMRSGSTLLKALLAVCPDVSHLPETNFQVLQSESDYKKLSKQPIVVLKRPRIYAEKDYPTFPSFAHKIIVLVRDVGPTVHSLLKMNQEVGYQSEKWDELSLAKTYWLTTYQSILERVDVNAPNVLLIRYEDILNQPITKTEELFSFIGSSRKQGTETYARPTSYNWQWYKDDGGENIKSLKVQPHKTIDLSTELVNLIKTDLEIIALRNQLGYH